MFDDLNKAKRKQVTDLASEFGITSEEVVAMLRSLDIVVRSHITPLTDEHVARARTRWERDKRARAAASAAKGVTKPGLPRKHRSFARRADNPDGWMAAYESGRRAAASGISRIENPIRAFNRKTYAAWFLGYDEASVEEVFSGYGDSAGVSAGDSAGVITGVSAGVIPGVSQGVVD